MPSSEACPVIALTVSWYTFSVFLCRLQQSSITIFFDVILRFPKIPSRGSDEVPGTQGCAQRQAVKQVPPTFDTSLTLLCGASPGCCPAKGCPSSVNRDFFYFFLASIPNQPIAARTVATLAGGSNSSQLPHFRMNQWPAEGSRSTWICRYSEIQCRSGHGRSHSLPSSSASVSLMAQVLFATIGGGGAFDSLFRGAQPPFYPLRAT